MLVKKYFTAILHKDDDMHVASCPELDIASQGKSIEEAKKNLEEAVELLFNFQSAAHFHSSSDKVERIEKNLKKVEKN